jgi:class 3 adenylate cyclase
MRCSACGFENPPVMKFCGKCGTPLEEPPAPAPDLDDTAERRNLTVMFCDLADATRLSEQLDPEELREIVRNYQRIAKEVVQRYQGHIAQYLGDGLMVYFGYPQAQGDDARRAVQAGLGIVDAVAAYGVRLAREHRLSLAVRVGIHTGDVVTGLVGTAQRREQLALGQTPNIAARLQHLAAPDEVVLSTATQKLTRGFFAFESLGAHAMKGLPDPMEIFRVVEESGVQSRFELAVRTGLTPLVGRRQELEAIRSAFSEAAAGTGRALLVTGEVGVGKSRLVHALHEELSETSHSWWSCQFLSDLRHSALVPVASSPRPDARSWGSTPSPRRRS